MHEVVPNAVRIADIIDARICNDHFTTSFFDIMQFTIYEFLLVATLCKSAKASSIDDLILCAQPPPKTQATGLGAVRLVAPPWRGRTEGGLKPSWLGGLGGR